MKAFTVNAKMMLEEEEKDELIASPKLRLAFQTRVSKGNSFMDKR